MNARILILSLFILGCSNDDSPNEEPSNTPQELIGKWKIVEVYETDGASEPQWRDENTGAIYDYWFKSDKSFMQSDGIYEGNYTVDSSLNLTLTINSSNTVKIEKFKSDSLIIDFLNFEPYKQKYIKISSESK
jgi:hypothetical protein